MANGEDDGYEFPDQWEDIFDFIPGVSEFREYEQEIARDLFEAGWMHHADEAGYSSDDVHRAREEFFEFTGLPEELFPWDEWRELMGYDE